MYRHPLLGFVEQGWGERWKVRRDPQRPGRSNIRCIDAKRGRRWWAHRCELLYSGSIFFRIEFKRPTQKIKAETFLCWNHLKRNFNQSLIFYCRHDRSKKRTQVQRNHIHQTVMKKWLLKKMVAVQIWCFLAFPYPVSGSATDSRVKFISADQNDSLSWHSKPSS